MTPTRQTAQRAVLALVAGAAALLPIAVRHGWLSAADAQDLGIGVAATAAAFHSGQLVADRLPYAGQAGASGPPLPGPADVPTAPLPQTGGTGAGAGALSQWVQP